MPGVAVGVCKTCIYAYRCMEADRGIACTDYVKGREVRKCRGTKSGSSSREKS